MSFELWLVRHGATEWSVTGQHTGRTDVPLTSEGEEQARALGHLLDGHQFALVLSSPMQRALATCRLAGYGADVVADADLFEWDYGEYEGRTTAGIRKERAGWVVWDGVPDGETVDQVGARVQRVIERAASASGDVVAFGHGHCLRILAACWLGLPPVDGRLFALDTATLSVLGHEREQRVIRKWNLSGSRSPAGAGTMPG
jgi:broad specificity phosphatase PhoE